MASAILVSGPAHRWLLGGVGMHLPYQKCAASSAMGLVCGSPSGSGGVSHGPSGAAGAGGSMSPGVAAACSTSDPTRPTTQHADQRCHEARLLLRPDQWKHGPERDGNVGPAEQLQQPKCMSCLVIAPSVACHDGDPENSTCGDCSSAIIDMMFEPPGPEVSWSMMTMRFCASAAGEAARAVRVSRKSRTRLRFMASRRIRCHRLMLEDLLARQPNELVRKYQPFVGVENV